jgi:hypothetical protein
VGDKQNTQQSKVKPFEERLSVKIVSLFILSSKTVKRFSPALNTLL